MQTRQNGPFDKFMLSSILFIVTYGTIKIYAIQIYTTNTCIVRINLMHKFVALGYGQSVEISSISSLMHGSDDPGYHSTDCSHVTQ